MLEHDVIMNRCYSNRDKLGRESLSEVERVITLVSWANFEIENGSLSQFYYNKAGEYAVETIWALNQIEAFDAASAVEKGNALLTDAGAYLRDRGQRYEKLKPLMNSAERPLDSLTDIYYAEDPDVWAKLCDYIDAHEQELRALAIIS